MGWLRSINLAQKPQFPKPISYVEWELPKAKAAQDFGGNPVPPPRAPQNPNQGHEITPVPPPPLPPPP
jgi:hypothetical protein